MYFTSNSHFSVKAACAKSNLYINLKSYWSIFYVKIGTFTACVKYKKHSVIKWVWGQDNSQTWTQNTYEITAFLFIYRVATSEKANNSQNDCNLCFCSRHFYDGMSFFIDYERLCFRLTWKGTFVDEHIIAREIKISVLHLFT